MPSRPSLRAGCLLLVGGASSLPGIHAHHRLLPPPLQQPAGAMEPVCPHTWAPCRPLSWGLFSLGLTHQERGALACPRFLHPDPPACHRGHGGEVSPSQGTLGVTSVASCLLSKRAACVLGSRASVPAFSGGTLMSSTDSQALTMGPSQQETPVFITLAFRG